MFLMSSEAAVSPGVAKDEQSTSVNMTASTEMMSASDMTDISHVEIRDGSVQIAHGSLNPTTVSLLRCKKRIVIPFYKLLGIIAWRPFGGLLHPPHALMNLVNVIYPVFIVTLLLFSYVTSALACRGESKQPMGNDSIPEIPINSPLPPHNTSVINTTNTTTIFWLDIHVFSQNATRLSVASRRSPDDEMWDPAYNECKHIFGTFILPSLLHLLAYCIGFYLYRIKQHEGLYVLMEKVFLQSPEQKRLYVTLWWFVVLGVIWLLFDMAVFVLFIFAFGPGTVTGFHDDPLKQIVTSVLMATGQLVLDLVNFVIILNYAAQCQLVIHYIRGITQRIEEKSTHLLSAMKDILDVKNTLQRMNSLLSLMVSLCIFTLVEGLLLGMIYIITDEHQSVEICSYRATRVLVCFMALFFPVVQAARVTTLGSRFKQISLDVRVFGHQTSSQLELDSFLVFVQSADLKARLFFAPIRGGFLCGLILITIFTLLILMHTGEIASNTKLF